MVVSERCLFMELRGKPSELFCCCGTFRGLQSELTLSMSSGCGIGGIQLTEILLSW